MSMTTPYHDNMMIHEPGDDMEQVIDELGLRDYIDARYKHGSSTDQASIMQAFRVALADIIDSSNPRYEADCIALAIKLPLRVGANQSDVARLYGVSREAISKRVKRYRDMLGLPREITPQQSLNYKLNNKRNYKY